MANCKKKSRCLQSPKSVSYLMSAESQCVRLSMGSLNLDIYTKYRAKEASFPARKPECSSTN